MEKSPGCTCTSISVRLKSRSEPATPENDPALRSDREYGNRVGGLPVNRVRGPAASEIFWPIGVRFEGTARHSRNRRFYAPNRKDPHKERRGKEVRSGFRVRPVDLAASSQAYRWPASAGQPYTGDDADAVCFVYDATDSVSLGG